MKTFIFISLIFMLMVIIPSASAACTLTCYVDDDGTGNFNVDHLADQIQINAAIDAVSANANIGSWGTVILNYTSSPYDPASPIIMKPYVNLIGETPDVTIRPATITTMPQMIRTWTHDVAIKNLTIDGHNEDCTTSYSCGTNARHEISFGYNTNVAYNITIENITGHDLTDDLIRGTVYNLTVKNIYVYNAAHSAVLIEGYQAYSHPHDISVIGVRCVDIFNACVRFDAGNNITIKDVYAEDTPGSGVGARHDTQYAIQISNSNTASAYVRNVYMENITANRTTMSGILIWNQINDPNYWWGYNYTIKNSLIDCRDNPTETGNRCNDGTYAGGPAGIVIMGVTDVVIDGVTIANTKPGISGIRLINSKNLYSSVTIKNSIIINNSAYGVYKSGNVNVNATYNDIWNNNVANVYGFTHGVGFMSENPLFRYNVNPIMGFRLSSQYGRWDGNGWIQDSITSPAIDAGDPTSDNSNEPSGQSGNRINIGFDGNTPYASKSSAGNYTLSGYVFDNNGVGLSGSFVTISELNALYYGSAISVSNGSFFASGLYNGSYNLTYSKSGFNTNVLNFTLSGANAKNKNQTIYDTTAPHVTGLTAIKLNRTAIQISYDATGSWYKIYRDGSLKTTTQEASWIDSSVSIGNTYQYLVSANDTYGNQGVTSSVNITIYPYTVTNLTPSTDTAIKSGQPGLGRSSSTWIDIGTLSGSTNGNYRGLLYFDVSTIPTSAKINSAILTLTWEGGNRNQTTVINVFRPSSLWDAQYASWNTRQNSISWTTQGGDWIDRNGVSYGSSPYSELTYPVGSTTDANFNVASIIQEYVNGNYPNTGFFLKANEIENTYISFYSSEASNANQRPKLTINYTTAGDMSPNPVPAITDFTPYNVTPQYPIDTSASFNVSVDQQVTNKWLFDNILQSETSRSYTKTWSFADAGVHNLTYSGENENGTVTTTWIVLVQNVINVPSAPQNLSAIPGYNKVDLSWQTPSSDGGAPITNYKIYRNGYLAATLGNILTYTDSNLTGGVEYSYQVSAINSAGESAKSSQSNIILSLNTVVNLTAINDTSIKSGQPNLMRGSSAWIDIGRLSGSTYGNYRGLLYFDVSTIPSSAKIDSAVLTLTWEGETRNQTTAISVYRPSSLWDSQYSSWNNRQNSVSWTMQGGDWIDRNGVSNGSSPYEEVTYPAGSTTDANFNVTSIIQEYVNGNYPNTGLFLKANELENTYISFHSSEASNASQRPKLTIYYTTGDTPSNPAPLINTFTPSGLTPQYPINTSLSFTVTTDQSVSNTWYSDGIKQDTSTQTWFNSWSLPGQHNVTYVGTNSNGSVSVTWNVSVVFVSSSYDVNLDGSVDIADLKVIKEHLGEVTSVPYPRYDVNANGKVDIFDLTLVSKNIK